MGVNKNSSEVTALFHQSKRTTTTFFDKISGEVIKLNKYVSNRNDNSDETCLLESDIWRTDAAEELSQSQSNSLQSDTAFYLDMNATIKRVCAIASLTGKRVYVQNILSDMLVKLEGQEKENVLNMSNSATKATFLSSNRIINTRSKSTKRLKAAYEV